MSWTLSRMVELVRRAGFARAVLGECGDFGSPALTGVEQVALRQAGQRRSVGRLALRLAQDGSVPVQPERLERAQDLVSRAWPLAGRVEVLDAHQPAARLRPRVEIAADGGHERTEMEGTAGGGGEAAEVRALTRLSADLSRDGGRGARISDTSRPGRRTASRDARDAPAPRRSASQPAAPRGA